MKLLLIYSNVMLDRTKMECYSNFIPTKVIGNKTVGYKLLGNIS